MHYSTFFTQFKACFLSIGLFFIATGWMPGGDEDAPLFQDNGILKLRMAMDVEALQGDRGKKNHYHPATLNTLSDPSRKMDISIKARGNFRRNPQNCGFPPLKLKFETYATMQSSFAYQKKLKLVTHCTDDVYVLKEYLLYKIYNLLSPNSFRVRLAEITYEDTEGFYPSNKQYAFFIEDESALAKRLQGIQLEKGSVKTDELEMTCKLTLALFEYMVGNLDWDVALQKNLVVMGFGNGGKPVAVPYDFDLSGAVSPPYIESVLGERVTTENTRKFKKVCCSSEELEKVIAHFQSQKTAIFTLIDDFSYLNKRHKHKLRDYLEDFFGTLDNSAKVNTTFAIECK